MPEDYRSVSYCIRQWLANVPVVSLVLLKLCQSDSGGSVRHAQWRWTRCVQHNDGPDSGAAAHCDRCSQGQFFDQGRTVCECSCHARYDGGAP